MARLLILAKSVAIYFRYSILKIVNEDQFMEQKICQSCAMPLTSDDLYGTNKDGSVNEDYCKWCYKDGEFIDDCSMEEYIEKCSQFGEQAGMTNEQMREYCTKIFPTLKRWKNNG